ncbi:MAG: hypothetical protein FWC01_02190 [Treponema sp.]|nr:hypothetical protein [Treponema sp.]MCL2236857.1 hypothetical protein [Treponema sp.]
MQINLFDLIKEVVASWQVIVVTLAILLYINIVTHVSKKYHTPRARKAKKIKTPKKKEIQAEAHDNLEELPASNSNDELGLEEA